MLGDVKKHFVFKSLLTTPINVLLLHLKQAFLPIIWIFTEAEGDGIKSRKPFQNLFYFNLNQGFTYLVEDLYNMEPNQKFIRENSYDLTIISIHYLMTTLLRYSTKIATERSPGRKTERFTWGLTRATSRSTASTPKSSTAPKSFLTHQTEPNMNKLIKTR